jgi:hypothetical protein
VEVEDGDNWWEYNRLPQIFDDIDNKKENIERVGGRGKPPTWKKG